ncbi:DUF1302 domain-containing protein [Colwellia psychrerythraea]|uniref:DUF1302 domain-containing protein n=1 Tax=Colwellia psychrerythraea TaxID=28229 RepID=A0A099KT39_COLPS|nr:DUF1302 domain-containing protein [Colwellia psychrerythraea]KGJ92838.1 protein of unknown function DUF1302 [Colwellia psychrerythraea]
MKNKPQHGFAKKPLAVGIAAALSLSVLTSMVNTAQAARWELGDVEISFDSTFSIGSSWRTEDRNWNDNVGKSNNANNGLDFSNYNIFSPAIPKEDVWAQGKGGYSTNGDNGNLNYNAGESFSKIFKGVHELDIKYQNVGVFVRGMYFYDYAMMDEDRDWSNPITGNVFDPCRDGEAKEQVCQDVRLLDAYIYGDFELGNMPFSVRLGDQVISWGESTLISHGISEINPVDVARLRAPGAEVKEAFIPFGALWASLGVTDNFNVEMFYQYSWEKTILPPPGSYFSTNDFAGDGGQYNNVQLGFGGNPDMNLDYLISGLNDIGNMVRAAAATGDPVALAAAQAQAGSMYSAYAGNVTLRAPGAKAENDPKDGGQYGLRLSWFVPELNDTEFSLYHVNYHSRRPIFSGVTANFGAETIGGDVAYLAGNEITEDNYNELQSFSRVELDYPEDIKMYALSFNTTLGTTAFAGEVSYRQDEPLQIDDVELLFAAVPQQLANTGSPAYAALDGVSQMVQADGTSYQPGQTAQGYILSDTVQAQMTLTHLFGPTFGASQLVGLVEVGGININDMPEQSELRLNGPGTARSGSTSGLMQVLQGGTETNPFPTEFAWGYRAVAKLDYTNVVAGINMSPRIVFSHDVSGITPDPLFLFIEDRKAVSLGINFDYQSRWSADLNYNSFFGGVGTTNKMEDRDYVSFSVSYSI